MKRKKLPFCEARIYIGSREGYGGEPFSEQDLVEEIKQFQIEWKTKNNWTCPVRLSKTSFICELYHEKGHELCVINYPRYPKSEKEVFKFAKSLQRYLLDKFKQHRVSIALDSTDTRTIEMLDSETD